MKTSEFITQCATGYAASKPRGGMKRVNRIAWDGEIVYSYGTHYPLLIPLKSAQASRGFVWVLNDRGYSVTTSKHIGMAGRFARYRVEIPRTFGTSHAVSPARLKEAAQMEHIENTKEIAALEAKAAARPRYAATYNRQAQEMRDRNAQLMELIAACEAATL